MNGINEIFMQGLTVIVGTIITIMSGIIVYYVKKWIGLEIEKEDVGKLLRIIKRKIIGIELSSSLLDTSGSNKFNSVIDYISKKFSKEEKDLLYKHAGSFENIIETELANLQPIFEQKKVNKYYKEALSNETSESKPQPKQGV
jgi:hypothetical protein